MSQRRQGTPLARVPTPHYELVGGNVVDDLGNGFSVVLFWIFYLTTDLSGSLTFPDHRHIGRRQMPVGCARRHVQTGDILLLMTGLALLTILAFSVGSAAHVLSMNVAIVALTREIAIRMAVEATWMFQDGNDGHEKLT